MGNSQDKILKKLDSREEKELLEGIRAFKKYWTSQSNHQENQDFLLKGLEAIGKAVELDSPESLRLALVREFSFFGDLNEQTLKESPLNKALFDNILSKLFLSVYEKSPSLSEQSLSVLNELVIRKKLCPSWKAFTAAFLKFQHEKMQYDEDHAIENLLELLSQYWKLFDGSSDNFLISILMAMLANESNTKILSTLVLEVLKLIEKNKQIFEKQKTFAEKLFFTLLGFIIRFGSKDPNQLVINSYKGIEKVLSLPCSSQFSSIVLFDTLLSTLSENSLSLRWELLNARLLYAATKRLHFASSHKEILEIFAIYTQKFVTLTKCFQFDDEDAEVYTFVLKSLRQILKRDVHQQCFDPISTIDLAVIAQFSSRFFVASYL